MAPCTPNAPYTSSRSPWDVFVWNWPRQCFSPLAKWISDFLPIFFFEWLNGGFKLHVSHWNIKSSIHINSVQNFILAPTKWLLNNFFSSFWKTMISFPKKISYQLLLKKVPHLAIQLGSLQLFPGVFSPLPIGTRALDGIVSTGEMDKEQVHIVRLQSLP